MVSILVARVSVGGFSRWDKILFELAFPFFHSRLLPVCLWLLFFANNFFNLIAHQMRSEYLQIRVLRETRAKKIEQTASNQIEKIVSKKN